MAKVNKHPDWMTTGGERQSYGLYFLGQNFFYVVVYMFLTAYLLMQGLTPAMTATVLVIVKVWDAVNDVFFGGLVDKIKFKKGGKFLPWLKISLIFIPIMTILMFAIPSGLSAGGKLIWFAVAYILWDTAYTICDVPIFGLVTTMTDNQVERTSIMATGRIYAQIGALVVILMGSVLTSEAIGLSFTWVAVILAVLGCAVMIPVCFKAKERVIPERNEEESFTFKQMFTYLGKNKYLLIFYLGLFFYYSLNTASTVTQFVAYYLFNNALLSTVLMVLGMLPAIIVAFFITKIISRVDKFKLFFIMNIVSACIGVINYLVGYSSFALHLIIMVLRGLCLGFVLTEMFMFTPDCAEYGQYKSGIEAKGITFAIQTFSVKLMTAISSALAIAILGWFGWQTVTATDFADLAAQGITQPQSALNGLWFIYALLPAIGGVIGCIVWSFYKLNDHDVQIMAKCNAGEITREEAESQLSRKY